MELFAEVLGTIAVIIGFSSQIPQIYKIIVTKDVSGIAVESYILAGITFFIYIIIGFITGVMSIVIGNIIRVCQIAVCVYLILKFRKGGGE